MSAITPKEMSREDWAKHVSDAYQTLRRHNYSIPDEVLDTIRGRLLGAPVLEARIAELEKVLEGAYALAIGHAATYQFQHELDAPHPTHKDILDRCRAALVGAAK